MQLTSLSLALTRLWAPYSPGNLFSAGEQGAWYDPSDFRPDWRYNLLTYTEQFDNAVWTKQGATVTANLVVAPNGTATADKIVESVNLEDHRVFNNAFIAATTAGVSYTLSVFVQSAGRSSVFIQFVSAGAPASNSGCLYNLLAITATPQANVQGSILDVGGGWFKLSITCVSPTAGALGGRIGPSTGAASSLYQGDGTSGIYIWGASLTTAANASLPYQRITDGVQDYLNYQAQPAMFQDAAGATPVTAVEQPVGLLLDKSRGLVLGSEMITAEADRTFSSDTGWWSKAGPVTIGGGVCTYTSVVVGSGIFRNLFIENRTYYEVTFTVSSYTSGSIAVYLGGTRGPTISAAGTYTQRLFSGGADRYFILESQSTATLSLDNISIKQITGNHAYQIGSTPRPVLSARVNLLTKTEQFDDAVWTKVGATVTPNAELSPIGTQTADSVLATGSNGFYTIASGLVSGVTYTISVYAKTLAGTIPILLFGPNQNPANGATTFNLQTATVSTPGAATVANSITAVGNGWCLCKVTFVATATTTVPVFYLFANGDRAAFWGASLVPANQAALPYQRVNTSTDYDTAGFPLYLRFDGVDDFLVTNSINFTATDKMTVFAGVRKLSDAAVGMLAELSTTRSTNNGAFSLSAPFANASAGFGFGSKGTLDGFVSAVGFAAPTTDVLTGVGDISGDTTLLRVDGAQVAQNTADQGTGNYGNYPLYIGRRGGTTLPFNGHLYSLIVRGAQSNAGQIGNTEQWVNSVTKAY